MLCMCMACAITRLGKTRIPEITERLVSVYGLYTLLHRSASERGIRHVETRRNVWEQFARAFPALEILGELVTP